MESLVFQKKYQGGKKESWNKLIFNTGEKQGEQETSLFPVLLMDFGLLVTNSNGDEKVWPCCVIIV